MHYKVHFKSQLWGDVNFEGEIPKDLGNADIDLLSVPKNSFLKQITGSKIEYKEFMRLIENHHWQGTSMIFDIQATHGMTLQVAEKCYVEYNV